MYRAGVVLQVDDAVLANMYDHLVSQSPRRYREWAELRIAALNRALAGIPGDAGILGLGEVEGGLVRVVVLSHELFTRRFGADRSLIGRSIQLNGEAWEVIGVTMPGQRYPRSAEIWTPFAFTGATASLRESRTAVWLPVIGRLRPDGKQAHVNLGMVKQQLGDLDSARASYERALQLSPDLPDVFYNLGSILEQQGHKEEAEKLYAKVEVALNKAVATAEAASKAVAEKSAGGLRPLLQASVEHAR